MALTNAEHQQAWRDRQKVKKLMGLDLGDDLDNVQRAELEDNTPMQYLLRVMNDPNKNEDVRIRVAGMLMPYMHEKADEAVKTKKEQKAETADEASKNGKYSAANPPRLVA